MLEVKNVHKSFGREQVLSELSFKLLPKQTLSILGRSGSGKTTLLKIIAGLEPADQGEVFWEETALGEVPPAQRGIVYLYQEALLFSHLNVFENIAFGLKIRKIAKKIIEEQVSSMLESLGLGDQSRKMPHQLSGGQKQRVSFGRALIINPKVLLLDEPFGNLDSETRRQMQDFFKEVALKFDLTAVFVSHDLKEALRMGDVMGRMEAGQLIIYPHREAFLDDPDSGVQEELAFWEALKKENHEKRL